MLSLAGYNNPPVDDPYYTWYAPTPWAIPPADTEHHLHLAVSRVPSNKSGSAPVQTIVEVDLSVDVPWRVDDRPGRTQTGRTWPYLEGVGAWN